MPVRARCRDRTRRRVAGNGGDTGAGLGATPDPSAHVDYWRPSRWPTDQFFHELTETRDRRIDIGRGTGDPEASVIAGGIVKKTGQASRLLGEPDSAEVGELAAEVDLMVVYNLTEPT
jgi:hypothetical protein